MKNTMKITITAFLFTLLSFTLMAATGDAAYTLPDTGIEKCYDVDGKVISCPPEAGKDFYRQDAHYNSPKMAYASSSDGTVTDSNTNLTWQNKWLDENKKEINVIKSNWQAACKYCDELELAEKSDWRLPDRRELFSIVDMGRGNPSINTAFTKTKNAPYWSKSESVSETGKAWYVNFIDGYLGSYGKTNGCYVRCVRSDKSVPSLSPSSYKDNRDGTVTDLNTDLMWQQKSDNEVYTWNDALKYSENLTLAKYSDWRLPNIRELETIVDYSLYAPAIYDDFTVTGNSGYWSSSTYVLGTQGAWALYSASGTVYARNKANYKNSVRCVRQGSSETPLDFTISPQKPSGYAPLTVSFSATVTGGISQYNYACSWDFGDGNTSNEVAPNHSYTNFGTYTAKCTVTDESGRTIENQTTITVKSAEVQLNIHNVNTDKYKNKTIQGIVSVRDGNGDVITGLTNSNFTLYEDDKPISSFTLDLDKTAVSLSLVLDYSGSMDSIPEDKNIENLEKAAYEFVTHMEDDDEAEIIKFNDVIGIEQQFTSEKMLLKNAIDKTFSRGGTFLYDAIYQGIDDIIVRPETNRKFIIVMTDGEDYTSFKTEDEVIQYAKDNKIPVYTIGLGSSISETTLKNIADGTGGLYYNAPDSSKLKEIYQEIAATVLHPYIIEYTTGVADAQEHTFKVDLNYAGVKASQSAIYSIPCSFDFCSSVTLVDTTACLNSVSVDLEFTTKSNSVSSISADITYDPLILTNPTATIGPDGASAGKEIIQADPGTSPVDPETFRFGIVSDDKVTYNSQIVIKTGVVARITFEVMPEVSTGDTTKLSIKISGASDPDGKPVVVEVDASGGKIDFNNEACRLGDCNGDLTVRLEEAMSAYDQFLGVDSSSNPPQGCNDNNGDGVISISDIQTIIMNYLEDCSKNGDCPAN